MTFPKLAPNVRGAIQNQVVLDLDNFVLKAGMPFSYRLTFRNTSDDYIHPTNGNSVVATILIGTNGDEADLGQTIVRDEFVARVSNRIITDDHIREATGGTLEDSQRLIIAIDQLNPGGTSRAPASDAPRIRVAQTQVLVARSGISDDALAALYAVSYTHLTLPTNREV